MLYGCSVHDGIYVQETLLSCRAATLWWTWYVDTATPSDRVRPFAPSHFMNILPCCSPVELFICPFVIYSNGSRPPPASHGPCQSATCILELLQDLLGVGRGDLSRVGLDSDRLDDPVFNDNGTALETRSAKDGLGVEHETGGVRKGSAVVRGYSVSDCS